jgi:uncharacterized membrane protein YdjX (TVP38/TMEM64 family)
VEQNKPANPPDQVDAAAMGACPTESAEVSTILPKLKEVFHRLGPIGPLAVISLSLPAIGTALVLFMLKRTDIAAWLRSQDGLGIAIYIGAYVVLAGLALCNTYAPSLVAGFAWRTSLFTASWAAMSAVTLAATIGYVVCRQASSDRVTRLINEQPKWKAVYDALIGGSAAKTLGIVALVRVSSSPFAMTNLLLGATRVNAVVYVLGTIIGFAPRTIATVVIGSKLSHWSEFGNAGARWFMVGGIIATLIVLSIIGTIANNALQRVTQKQESE